VFVGLFNVNQQHSKQLVWDTYFVFERDCYYLFVVQPRNPCVPNPCKNEIFKWNDKCFYLGLNGGQCVQNGAGFICNCPATFTGNRCEAPGK
jgi:hypothetical protein